MAARIYFNGKLVETIVCQSTVCSRHHVEDPDAFLDLLASMEASGFTIELF